MSFKENIAIIGGGNIGMSIAEGLVASGEIEAKNIIITRRKADLPSDLNQDGFTFQADNKGAIKNAKTVIFTVLPQLMQDVLNDIKTVVTEDKLIISVATGIDIQSISDILKINIPIFRAMPNTAIRVRESMTCICCNEKGEEHLEFVKSLFDLVGKTLIIDEEFMSSATALGSCGIAFFLRSIRAASQGGTQIGFHAEEAQLIASQTAKGAAELLLKSKTHTHPEDEIDKVTTPRGVTIAGLNEMEHNGFSSALIKGIVTSYEKSQTKKKNKKES